MHCDPEGRAELRKRPEQKYPSIRAAARNLRDEANGTNVGGLGPCAGSATIGDEGVNVFIER
jgi:hypothetical protein